MFGHLVRHEKLVKTMIWRKIKGKEWTRNTKKNFLRANIKEGRCNVVQGGKNASRRSLILLTRAKFLNNE